MATTHDTIVDAIHAQLDSRLVAAGGSAIDYGIGRDQRGKNARRPRIVWDDSQTGGTIERIKAAGGNPHHLALDRRSFDVSVWHSSRENCLLTLHNLIASTYYAGYQKEAVVWGGDYSITADGASRSGVVLTTRCTVTIVATLDIFATPTVTEFDGEGIHMTTGEVFSTTSQTRGFSIGFGDGIN